MIATVRRGTLCELSRQAAMGCPALSDITKVQAGIHMDFSQKKGTMTLTGSNSEFTVQVLAPADVEDAGSIVINRELLPEIAKRLPEEEVFLESKNNGHLLHIKSGHCEYELNVLPGNTYVMPDMPFPSSTVSMSKLPELIRTVDFAAASSTEQRERPILKAINLWATENGLMATASNGIQYVQAAGDRTCVGEAVLSIPATTLRMLAKLSKDGSVYDVGSTGKNIVFWDGSLLFSARLIDGDVIEPTKIFTPFKALFTAVADAAELRGALEMATALADKHSKVEITLNEHGIHFYCGTEVPNVPNTKEGKATATGCWGQSAGDVRALVNLVPEKPFYFAANYLSQALEQMTGEVSLDFSAQGHLVLFNKANKVRCFQSAVRASDKAETLKRQSAPKKAKTAA